MRDESGASDLGDAGRVWLCSDIFDCIFVRNEVSINQVRSWAQRAYPIRLYMRRCTSLQYDLQRDLGDMSNLKSYLSARLQKMDITQQNFMHLTRKYYHQVAGNEVAVDHQRWRDVHRSRHVNLYGRLTGLTNGMTHLLPPHLTFDFKVRRHSINAGTIINH